MHQRKANQNRNESTSPVRWLKSRPQKVTAPGQDVDTGEHSDTAGGNIKRYGHPLWRIVQKHLTKLNIMSAGDAIVTLDIYLPNMKA